MRDKRRPSEVWTFLALALPAVAIFGAIAFAPIVVATRRPRRYGNESAAIGALKTIATAEAIYREGDKDRNGALDYGTLAQLASTGLIDQVLASGTKQGYVFEVRPSATTSEFLWFATASPELPRLTGDRYFCANHTGVIFYSLGAPALMNDTTCEIPSSWIPAVGK